jgi:phosphate starvation-inducible PhoH-like protein
MAADRGNKSTKQTSKSTEAFNAKSAEGAPSPVLNRQQLITQVKGILEKNASGNTYKTHDGEEELNPSSNQKALMQAVADKTMVFVDGPFGTGKTIWTTYMGLSGLASKKYRRIGISVPAVSAGEDLGFLPGGMEEKMLPHIKPILDSIDDWIGKDLRIKLQEAGVIDVEPQAFMRGRTMKKTFLIIDESQNATGPQLMTTLGRLGFDSTFVFMGDNRQNDRTKADSAYVQFMNRFTADKYINSGYVDYVVLGTDDVRRHPFLKFVVENDDHRALEQFAHHRDGQNATVISIHERKKLNKEVSVENAPLANVRSNQPS